MHPEKLMHSGEGTGAPATQSEATRPVRILVVDDDPVLCLFNAELLAKAGFEVDTAPDGEAGLDALQMKRYDLLITDNNMPKISGLELLRTLRLVDKALPAILVSGAMPLDELKREPQLRLAAMLPKPFTPHDFLSTVRDVLKTKRPPHRETATARSPGESAALAA
jgi:DNA-binding response OmpR family regulator